MYAIYQERKKEMNKTHFYRNMMRRRYGKELAELCGVAMHLLDANERETCLFSLQEG